MALRARKVRRLFPSARACFSLLNFDPSQDGAAACARTSTSVRSFLSLSACMRSPSHRTTDGFVVREPSLAFCAFLACSSLALRSSLAGLSMSVLLYETVPLRWHPVVTGQTRATARPLLDLPLRVARPGAPPPARCLPSKPCLRVPPLAQTHATAASCTPALSARTYVVPRAVPASLVRFAACLGFLC
ncbi:hypothetical protein FKP32DRAFT_151017 [Trametes sanguinea]|nr:hypothetical protein FKP32DRAFT_151017 [Trametes sanguinea]